MLFEPNAGYAFCVTGVPDAPELGYKETKSSPGSVFVNVLPSVSHLILASSTAEIFICPPPSPAVGMETISLAVYPLPSFPATNATVSKALLLLESTAEIVTCIPVPVPPETAYSVAPVLYSDPA